MLSRPLACLLPDQPAAEEEGLRELAFSFTPEVAAGEGEGLFLGLAGVLWRWGTEQAVGEGLLQAAAARGLPCRVGVAGRAWVARLAARDPRWLRIIPAGGEERFIENLPLEDFALPDILAGRLSRLGLRRAGELMRLSASQVQARLGAEGLRLWRRCRGLEEETLRPLRPPEFYRVEFSPDPPLEELPRLEALLEELFRLLAPRLAADGRWLQGLRLELAGGGQRTVRMIALGRPVERVDRGARRGLLEGLGLAAPVEKLVLQALPGPPQPVQQGLFGGESPAGDTAAQMPAGIVLWRMRPVDSHLPGEFTAQPYRTGVLPAGRGLALLPGLWRALRPPRPARVECRGERPARVEPGDRRLAGGRVVEASGPWRFEGRWWSHSAFSRDYFEVQLSSGRLYRLFRDRLQGVWFIDGLGG